MIFLVCFQIKDKIRGQKKQGSKKGAFLQGIRKHTKKIIAAA